MEAQWQGTIKTKMIPQTEEEKNAVRCAARLRGGEKEWEDGRRNFKREKISRGVKD